MHVLVVDVGCVVLDMSRMTEQVFILLPFALVYRSPSPMEKKGVVAFVLFSAIVLVLSPQDQKLIGVVVFVVSDTSNASLRVSRAAVIKSLRGVRLMPTSRNVVASQEVPRYLLYIQPRYP